MGRGCCMSDPPRCCHIRLLCTHARARGLHPSASTSRSSCTLPPPHLTPTHPHTSLCSFLKVCCRSTAFAPRHDPPPRVTSLCPPSASVPRLPSVFLAELTLALPNGGLIDQDKHADILTRPPYTRRVRPHTPTAHARGGGRGVPAVSVMLLEQSPMPKTPSSYPPSTITGVGPLSEGLHLEA